MAICQYDGVGTTAPSTTLWAARHLDSAAAARLLHQLREAPDASGPNDPTSCVDNFEVGGTLVVRLYTEETVAP